MRDEIIEKVVEELKKLEEHKFLKLTKDNIKEENYTKHIFDALLELQNTAIKNAEKLLNLYERRISRKFKRMR